MPAPICGNCRWYVQDHTLDHAPMICIRYPPTVVTIADVANTRWPRPQWMETCGEHKPQEKTDAVR